MELLQARKALNALKGLVKLQAVVRGELVRRRVVQKLRRISSLAKTESQQHQMALPTLNQYHDHDQKKQSFSLKEVIRSEELKVCEQVQLLLFHVEICSGTFHKLQPCLLYCLVPPLLYINYQMCLSVDRQTTASSMKITQVPSNCLLYDFYSIQYTLLVKFSKFMLYVN